MMIDIAEKEFNIPISKANQLLITPRNIISPQILTIDLEKIKEMEFTRPEQVWVSDITYIGNRKNPSYLALITDAYAKKIVGFNVSDSLNLNASLSALEIALKNRMYKDQPMIHHSDRGLQYCSNE